MTMQDMSQAEINKIMADMDAQRTAEAAARWAKNETVLKKILELKGTDFYIEVLKYLEGVDGWHTLALEPTRAGDPQEIDTGKFSFKTEWVNQSCGASEDDYYGDVFIIIRRRLYLKISFSS